MLKKNNLIKYQKFQNKIKKLQSRLSEVENVLHAIKGGDVDALLIKNKKGKNKVYTLTGAEYPYRMLVESINEGAVTLMADGSIYYANNGFSKLVNIPLKKIIGTLIYDYVAKDQNDILKKIIAKKTKLINKYEFKLICKGRSTKDVYFSSVRLKLEGFNGTCIIVTDITELKKIQKSLMENEVQYRNLVELSPYGIFIQYKNKIVYANTSLAKMLSIDNPKKLVGKKLENFFDKSFRLNVSRHIDYIFSKKPINNDFEIQWKKLNGELIQIEIMAIEFPYQGETAHQIIMHDVTQKKQAEEKLKYMVSHDVLTGLPSRSILRKFVNDAISLAGAAKEKIAILFLDVDHFNAVNDTLGRDVGDKLLKQIAMRIKQSLRATDFVSRIGADEFIIVLGNIKLDDQVIYSTERIISMFERPFVFDRYSIDIKVSIGISIYPDDGVSSNDLINHANVALVKAKEAGRNNFKFCTEEMAAAATKKITIEKDLAIALNKNEFTLYYQPQISLKRQEIVGVEALIRWFKNGNKVISPAEFIGIAEDSGLILPLGKWVMKTACHNYLALRKEGLLLDNISINISPLELYQVDFFRYLSKTILDTKIDPRNIMLELTENMFIKDIAGIARVLKNLKQLGIKLSIDDFGKGYSSLGYLQVFGIDQLKIDMSFIQNIGKDKKSEAIVLAVIGMAHNLNLEVIAEGVEKKEQLDFLIEHDCDLVQGNYFYEALPYEKIKNIFTNDYKSSLHKMF